MWTTYDSAGFTDYTNKNKIYADTGAKKYRLYLYETRIVQEIQFRIKATAEGGAYLKTDVLTLNVTCPSYATVAEPNGDAEGPVGTFSHGTKNVYNRDVVMYIGAKEVYNEYNFPGFYPTFE